MNDKNAEIKSTQKSVDSSTAEKTSSILHSSQIPNNYAALTPPGLITASGVLLAFLLGFYTLIARERKSPYLINSAVWILLVCMGSALAGSIAMIVDEPVKMPFLYGGGVLLLTAVTLTAWRVYRLAIRLAYFVDTANPKHFPIVRWVKKISRTFSSKLRYEHNTVPFDVKVVNEILSKLTPADFDASKEDDKRKSIQQADLTEVRSIAMRLDHHGKASDNLAKMVLICLAKNYAVQYLTASRHPTEFIEYVKREYEKEGNADWARVASNIIVIDAYTPHFGFTDSIYQEATKRIDGLGVNYLPSTETFAGLHTAASIAFNRFKKKQQGVVRSQALIIYEDCYALTDLESIEQYRIFLRHVIPSERLWRGMLTVFVETAQGDSDWKLLKSYADAVFDLRSEKENKEK